MLKGGEDGEKEFNI